MEQYIPKSVLVAEVEKRRKEAELNCGGYKSYNEHRCDDCTVDFYNEFLEIIDTIEAKDMDFGCAVERYIEQIDKQSEKQSTDNLTQQEAMDIAVAKCFNEQEAVDKVEPKFHES